MQKCVGKSQIRVVHCVNKSLLFAVIMQNTAMRINVKCHTVFRSNTNFSNEGFSKVYRRHSWWLGVQQQQYLHGQDSQREAIQQTLKSPSMPRQQQLVKQIPNMRILIAVWSHCQMKPMLVSFCKIINMVNFIFLTIHRGIKVQSALFIRSVSVPSDLWR